MDMLDSFFAHSHNLADKYISSTAISTVKFIISHYSIHLWSLSRKKLHLSKYPGT
jgi:hypothetical protein